MLLYFIILLAAKYVSPNNQPCTAGSLLINFDPDKLHYYTFMVSLDSCDGSCNTFEDPFGWICLPNKIEDVNFKVLSR